MVTVWDHFGKIKHVGVMLGSFWGYFGNMLGSFWKNASFWDTVGIMLGIVLGTFWDRVRTMNRFGIMLGSF